MGRTKRISAAFAAAFVITVAAAPCCGRASGQFEHIGKLKWISGSGEKYISPAVALHLDDDAVTIITNHSYTDGEREFGYEINKSTYSVIYDAQNQTYHAEMNVDEKAVLSTATPEMDGNYSLCCLYDVPEGFDYHELSVSVDAVDTSEDGTVVFSYKLNDEVNGEMRYPAAVINKEGECVGIQYNSTVSCVAPWADAAAVEANKPSNRLETIKGFLKNIPLLPAIVAAVILLLGAITSVIILIKGRKKKKHVRAELPGARPAKRRRKRKPASGKDAAGAGLVNSANQSHASAPDKESSVERAPQTDVIPTGIHILCEEGPMAGTQYTFNGDDITFGTSPTATVAFEPETPGVAQIHCKITMKNGCIAIEDMDSEDGTFIDDGTRLMQNEFIAVRSGMVFRFGTDRYKFKIN